jgi:CheY-like chemotaxis protein
MLALVPPVVYLVRDLFFASKIQAVADQLGVEVRSAASAEALQAAARGARLAIVDLRLPEALHALELLAGDPATADVPAVGFVDHERLDVMESARALGATQVMAKGQFASMLPRLLQDAAKNQ